jgi:hypothetical protein
MRTDGFHTAASPFHVCENRFRRGHFAATSQEQCTTGLSAATAAVHSRFMSWNCTPSCTNPIPRGLKRDGPEVEDGGQDKGQELHGF